VNSLLWIFGIGLTAISGAVAAGAPNWLLITFACFSGIVLLAFLSAYFYCLFRDPNLLRSEKFNIRKLEIETLQVGDSLNGTFERPMLQTNDQALAENAQSIEGPK
jgi:hypothetical protein